VWGNYSNSRGRVACEEGLLTMKITNKMRCID